MGRSTNIIGGHSRVSTSSLVHPWPLLSARQGAFTWSPRWSKRTRTRCFLTTQRGSFPTLSRRNWLCNSRGRALQPSYLGTLEYPRLAWCKPTESHKNKAIMDFGNIILVHGGSISFLHVMRCLNKFDPQCTEIGCSTFKLKHYLRHTPHIGKLLWSLYAKQPMENNRGSTPDNKDPIEFKDKCNMC